MDKEINGHMYALGKMPALTQFHVLRRISPLLARLQNLPGLMKMAQGMEAGDRAAVLFSAAGPLAEAFAEMKDEDANYVIFSAFAVARRKEKDKSAPMLAPDGFTFMYQDIEMPEMIELTVAVLKENFGNFFDMLPAENA